MKRVRGGAGRTYLLTGATGFLGSHVMAALLRKGDRLVVLGRSAGREPLAERIGRLLKWFAIEPPGERLEFLEADFLRPGLGLAAGEYERLRRRGLPVIHCASDTRFAEKNRDAVMDANVAGLAGILELACRSRARCFHFISSAYAAGMDRDACPEAPVSSRRFHNVYEESKALAEERVCEQCRRGGIPHTIIRPAIVYGDARTGRSLRFNALYHPVRSLMQIRDIYVGDIHKNGGKKSAPWGICLGPDGILRLPLRIFIPHPGKINLIPVDYFTEALLAVLDQPENGTFYHLTSRRPASMTQLAEFTQRFLGLAGIGVTVGTAGADDGKNPPEELFDYFIKPYRPYISDTRAFNRENTDRVTRGAQPPDFSYEIFEKCMAFAVAVDWGKKLF
jgi:nucleoside-diphosphate-sugar epimerase